MYVTGCVIRLRRIDFLQSSGADATSCGNVYPILSAPYAWPIWSISFPRNTLERADVRIGAQDRIGITIESTSAIAFVGLLNAMAIFPADRNLYLHESKSSARYSPATFVLTYTIVELGFELLGAFGYAAIVSRFRNR